MLPSMESHQKLNPSPSFDPAREEGIFHGALAREPRLRPAFLNQACGDDLELRKRLELLLKSYEQSGKFLEPAPAAGKGSTVILPEPPSEKPGDVIGHYKIRERLGEGGCGVVYVAEQTEPVRRRVALKIIKLGMDTRNVIARFEAERQALAMMDHPNIAKVLDAGATATGRPFFVMELVRGIPITDYCDQNQLNTAQRLGLFVQVCHAVQHAHQKGVIHRDIKPSNILVTLHDGMPVPKVIDFGIAKATEGRLTDLTIYTELRQFIGTPAYMSPEQAEMSGLDIDTRSDIYSLGVLLYELLTGRTPFDARELVRSGLDAMRRTIREKEPLAPSTCLRTMVDAELARVAKQQNAEAPKLVRFIRGDLDWIVMKALEKDRTRRFESASGLALDVQRFLSNEPIEARPPSGFYRFQKLVRRHRTTFAAAAAVFFALVLGLGASLFLFVQERQALRNERAALARAVAAERRQAELREQAERGLALEKELREMAPITEKFTTAGRLLSQGKLVEGEAMVSDIPLTIPQGSIFFNAIGDVYARQGDWTGAIRNFSRSVTADPTNYHAYHYLAPLLLRTGDLAGYEKNRDIVLRRFGQTADPALAGRVAKDCLLTAPRAGSAEGVARLAEAALGAGPGGAASLAGVFTKALSEYRQGHFAGAREWLQKLEPNERAPAHAVQVQATRAMVEQRLGQADAARAALTQASTLADQLKQPNDPDWNEVLIAQFLLHEAQALNAGGSPPAGEAK